MFFLHNSENGYDASGSDNNSPDIVQQQQQQQQQPIQIQQISAGGGQRVIQVVRPGQSLLISAASTAGGAQVVSFGYICLFVCLY